ncbi:hypothetical protein BG000_007460 [Podila horticola]|nr:hypothetical protein BG000_007460 [Podila horticola]
MSTSSTQTYKPKVLIVGAGIGDVPLAILLEKAGIPYQDFEQISEMKFLESYCVWRWNIECEAGCGRIVQLDHRSSTFGRSGPWKDL